VLACLLQAPSHEAKTLPAAGVAVSPTTVGPVNVCVQVPVAVPLEIEQLIAAGLDVMVPLPAPVPLTVSVSGPFPKIGVTF
jgi:hypothetical protein